METEKEYTVPALGVDVVALRKDDSTDVVFYNSRGFVAFFDAADGAFVTTKNKPENLADIEFAKTLCGFAIAFVLDSRRNSGSVTDKSTDTTRTQSGRDER
ncbi:MAG: hypothetical protein LUD72_08990 [Bacteroidales bacterium]|nr:hypothetical protein [Bacteroidales bacterium]